MQSGYQFLILPSERLLQYSAAANKLTLHLDTRTEDCVVHDQKLALISGKSVKYYNIENGFTSGAEPFMESYFPKKVQGVTIDTDGKVVVTDKFGDLYEARSQNSLYLNSNLGIPTFVKHIKNLKSGKEFIILGDDYCKFKVYNYRNMHEIYAIWYVPNSVPLDVLQIDQDTVVLLVKHEDKENLQHTYKMYQFNVQDLENPDFTGPLVYADKTETLNNTEYHPCSVTYCDQNKTLYFLKLYDDSIDVISFNYNCNEKQGNKLTLAEKKSLSLSHPVTEGNSIEGITLKQGNELSLLISYGTYYNVDNEVSQSKWRDVEMSEFKQDSESSVQVYPVNDNQFLLNLKLN